MDEVLHSEKLSILGFLNRFSLRSAHLREIPVAELFGFPTPEIFEVHQVHSAEVRIIRRGDNVKEVRHLKADALVAWEPNLAIGVHVADCLPLLLADPDTGAVAAVHAGWRGIVQGVVKASVQSLISSVGSSVEHLRAAIFPHIRPCCFEVGFDVAERLAEVSSNPGVVNHHRSRPHVDLAAIVHSHLLESGLDEACIDDIAGCTKCQPERFFSYRREGTSAGRHIAAIVTRA